MSEIGTTLRAARGARSIYRVERDSAISHSSISKAERGLALPTLALMRRLARCYGCEGSLHDWIAASERDRTAAQREQLRKEVVSIGERDVA